jgi:outer membrane lipoprotein carrier protein
VEVVNPKSSANRFNRRPLCAIFDLGHQGIVWTRKISGDPFNRKVPAAMSEGRKVARLLSPGILQALFAPAWRILRFAFAHAESRSISFSMQSRLKSSISNGMSSSRLSNLIRLVCLVWIVALTPANSIGSAFQGPSQDDGIANLLDQVQKKYSTLVTYRANFVQKFYQGKDQRVESGVLMLGRGGKMRWEYFHPQAKLFLVDGKMQYTWIPSENRVYRESVKSSEDRRTPILMLLGKLHWRKVFGRVERVNSTGDDHSFFVRAFPKDESFGYQDVVLEVERNTLHLLRITVDNVDRSRMEFSFSESVENPLIDPQRFQFRIPRGAEIVDQAGAQ